MEKPHIVIVGGGFAGLQVARGLLRPLKQGKIKLTLINTTNYFLFTPLLHEVATGGLSASSVAEPLREVFVKTKINIIQGIVTQVDADQKIIALHDQQLTYDILVLATGATTNYFNVPGAREFALPLKTLADALQIRGRIIDAFESASQTTDASKRRELLSFVVVGGGATGVELAAELAEFAFSLERRYFAHKTSCILSHEVSVNLVSSSSELLAQFPPATRRIAASRLQQLGVILRLGSQVGEVEADGVNLHDGWRISSSLTIWTAGVKSTLADLVIEPATAELSKNIFILGDISHGFPLLAQVAVAQAKVVAKNILLHLKGHPLKTFVYQSKGSFVSLGQWFAAGTIGKINLHGRLTWWLWRTIYLFKFASHKKRLRIVLDWTMNLFYPRDITHF